MHLSRELLAQRHRLSQQQIDRFLNENKAGLYPAEKLKQLERFKKFLQCTDILRTNNISFTCIKGPLLSWRMYNDPTVRISRDFDLLLQPEEVDRGLNVLFEAGFLVADEIKWPKEPLRQELLMTNAHHIMLMHPEQKTCVEVHWTLTHETPLSIKQVAELVKRNRTTIEVNNRSFNVLSAEMELLYLIIHGSKHSWMRLKWLDDIAYYPTDSMNKEKFRSLVAHFGAERIIAQTNKLLQQYYQKTLFVDYAVHVPKVMLRFPEFIMHSPVMEKPDVKRIAQNIYYWQAMFKPFGYKLKQLRVLFVRSGDIVNEDLPSKYHYYLYRPFSFIKRRIFHV